MKALDWLKLFQKYARQHNKHVFTSTELANLSGASPRVLRVTLSRLQREGVVLRLAQGLYGPEPVSAQALVPCLDPCAYVTGFAALHHHGHVDQVPRLFTCFTNRRHSSRVRRTGAGTIELLTISEPIYSFPTGAEAPVAPPEQAFYDHVYRCRLQGVGARGLTLRRLDELRPDVMAQLAERYPRTVRDYVAAILANRPSSCDTPRSHSRGRAA
jgi:hypothetical protein